MKNFLLAFFILFQTSINVFSQDVNWVRNDGGSGNSSSFKSVIDKNGSIYILGNFSGTVFKNSYQLTSSGNDIFICKYNKIGELKVDQKNTVVQVMIAEPD
ncbi:MAG: hypothetical protein HC905_21370 [Bacteroidales bacterium]|nr:hypothetical protein [Bacteroidales bacterium]